MVVFVEQQMEPYDVAARRGRPGSARARVRRCTSNHAAHPGVPGATEPEFTVGGPGALDWPAFARLTTADLAGDRRGRRARVGARRSSSWRPATNRRGGARCRSNTRIAQPREGRISAASADHRVPSPDQRPGCFLHASACSPPTWTLGGSYRSTFEMLVAVIAWSCQRSKVARSVHASMRASSSSLDVSC